jgi:saccharopine dehydrogenase-like NADP-dependent oxidoreductase
MKVLILGGYGVFGGRLAQLLRGDPGLTLIIAGRDGVRARAFCDGLGGPAEAVPLTLDRADIARALQEHRPDLVVDASGPFQAYGDRPYLVPEAAIAAGVPYLDLADGAAFVEGITTLDAAARKAGVFVLAGVSSFPVLTHAVLAEMSRRIKVTSLTGGIAPSPYAGVGLNVLRAVLGYAGSPVRLWRDGGAATGIGLGDSLVATVAVPGRVPLRPLRFSLVDVPDLRVLPSAHPGLQSLWMGAAPQPGFLHRLLTLMALARARLRLPSLAPLAPLAYWLLNLHPMGEHRGGMFLAATGTKDGQPVQLSWHLLAEGDDGPLIPSMAVALLVQAMRAGRTPAPGARAGIGALTLADYDTGFAGRTISTGWREDVAGSVYPRTLGPVFADLPPLLQRLHQPGARAVWAGSAEVSRGRNPAAALVCGLFGFPRAGVQPVTVTFTTDANGRETWDRRFGNRLMRSTQSAGRGRDAWLVVERFGPFRFGLALDWDGRRLRIIPRHWALGPVPLPRWLMPKGPAWEEEEAVQTGGRFRFHVEIILPLIGPVVRYEGWLEPKLP